MDQELPLSVISETNLLRIVKSLKRLKQEEHLILKDYTLFTRLDVSVLYILSHTFTEIGLVKPKLDSSAIFLSECKDARTKTQTVKLLETLEQDLKDTKPDSNDAILEAVPINSLTSEPFYSMCAAFNVLVLKEKSSLLVSDAQEALKQ